MARRVFKYPVPLADYATVLMPAGAKVVAVGEQGGGLVMWAIVDDANAPAPVDVYVRGTGHAIPGEAARYAGTVHAADGFVWHIFVRGA